jgi:hypothetical protein
MPEQMLPGQPPGASLQPEKEEASKFPFRELLPQELQPKPSEGTNAEALEGITPGKTRDTSTFFERMGRESRTREKKGESPTEIEEGEEAELPLPTTPFSEAVKEPVKEKKETQKKEVPPPMTQMELPTEPFQTPAPVATTSALSPLPPYAMMHPEVQELFDRMVGVMTVMNMSGLTETVITLNMPQFASSVFFGTQIIIHEFSSAPQAFNIQLNGTPQAVDLFQNNVEDLMAAFQSGNYNFRVNRLDTGYFSEKPLFRRKEKAEGKNQDKPGDPPP